MKIKSISKKRKYVILAAILIVGAGAGLFAYVYAQSVSNSSTEPSTKEKQNDNVDYDAPAPEEVKAGNDKKAETVEQDSAPAQPTTSLNVSISASQQNGDIVQIRALVDNIVANGSCQLELSQGSKKVTKTAPIQALPSSSTCQGFDVPVSELSAGSWSIAITAISGSATGSTKGSVTVTP